MKVKGYGIAIGVALAVASAVQAANAAPYGSLELWRSYSGVTWDVPASAAASVQPAAHSADFPIAGIHQSHDGRTFVSTPRVIATDSPGTLNTLDLSVKEGPARLKAFPSVAANALDQSPDKTLRNVLGFYVDATHGWVWALDMGYIAGEKEAPAGGQKVVIYNQKTGQVVKRIPLDAVADRSTSFLNDIVVDETRRVAYISDSGLRGQAAGLIVVDLKLGTTRRVLDKSPVVQPEEGVDLMSHGLPVLPGYPLRVGINGIALSPDASTLYWTVTSGLQAHSVPTRILRESTATDAAIEAQVVNLGNVGGNTDGIVTDKHGDLYITDLTRNGIVRYDLASKQMSLIAADDRIHWADTLTVANDGALWFTSSGLNEHFMKAIKPGEERYDIWRLPAAHK